MAYESGLRPQEYYDSPFSDVLESIQAKDARDVQAWRNTREITYMVYAALTDSKDKISKAEFMPLPGDKYTSKQDRMQNMITRLKKEGILK